MHPKNKQTVFGTTEYYSGDDADSDDEPESPSEMTVDELRSSIAQGVSAFTAMQTRYEDAIEPRRTRLEKLQDVHGTLREFLYETCIRGGNTPSGIMRSDESHLPDDCTIPADKLTDIATLVEQQRETARSLSHISPDSNDRSVLLDEYQKMFDLAHQQDRQHTALIRAYETAIGASIKANRNLKDWLRTNTVQLVGKGQTRPTSEEAIKACDPHPDFIRVRFSRSSNIPEATQTGLTM